MTQKPVITLEMVQEVQRNVSSIIDKTPLVKSRVLSPNLYLKRYHVLMNESNHLGRKVLHDLDEFEQAKIIDVNLSAWGDFVADSERSP